MNKKETKEHYLEAINRAIEFIESNYCKKIVLEDIAAYSFLSKFHFHRIFKSIIGATAKEYLVRLRLEKAALQLKNSRKEINQIAYDCGYSSPETFNRAFKSFFLTTPILFRKYSKKELAKKDIAYSNISFESLNISQPKIIEKENLNLAYIRHFGSYEKIDTSFERLLSWANQNLLLNVVPLTLGIVHDNPDLTEESNLRFDAGIVVSKEIQPKGEIGFKKVNGGKFATFRYKGPFESFYSVYDYIYNTSLFEYKWELRDEPILESYISPPPFLGCQELLTDFYLPIL